MVVPAYCRTATGRVFRLLRSSELVAPDRVRFVLRAQAINAADADAELEQSREVDAELIRDKIAYRQAVPTPETTFEELWGKLRLQLDARDAS
jgi:hypothetical protein